MTITYFLKQPTDKRKQPVYVSISFAKGVVVRLSTTYVVSGADWNTAKAEPKQNNPYNKNLKISLDQLKEHLYNYLNHEVEPSSSNIKNQILLFKGATPKQEQIQLTELIQQYIEDLKNRNNSNNTIKTFITFKNIITDFQAQQKIKELNLHQLTYQNTQQYKQYLTLKNYSFYSAKVYTTCLKTVLKFAKKNKFKFDYNLIDDIEQNNHNKETKRIITLSTQELEQIDKTPMPSTELENTKKWLLLGCELGQRASDLFRIKESDIFTENNIEVIELTQQKTKKRVMIPITPRAREIINTGFPTKIKLVNFNEQIKKVCEIAQINIKIKSYKQNGTNTKTEIIAPKWNFITSHIMRRSFATNYYGIIPTPLIISVTGHSTETVFLNYIGKTPTDNAHAFLQALQKFQKNNPS